MKRRRPLVQPAMAGLAVVATLFYAATAQAAVAGSTDASAPPPAEGAPASPRTSLERYLALCRDGDFAGAADYLALPPARTSDGPRLARRLKAVLNRYLWIDLGRVSALPTGDPADGMPDGVDEIGHIPGAYGGIEAVRMARRDDRGGVWVFSAGTVDRIDGWYTRLPARWILDHLPDALLQPGPAELLWWQWLALPILAALVWFLGALLGRFSKWILGRAAARTSTTWDDELLARLGGPLTFGWALALAFLTLPLLALYTPAEAALHRGLRAAIFVLVFWSGLRCLDVLAQVLGRLAAGSHTSRALIPLGTRVAKVLLVVILVISVLTELGYPVASLLAGLGIGGLALALAAQKTVENLFGAVAVAIDQPFREGDFIKFEDFVGTVEAVGLRSTRIRTLDRTVIAVPNARIADTRVESFAARDRIRLFCEIGLVYETTAGQMRSILAGLERVLREHPMIWPDAVIVRFTGFGASSLDLQVMAWFQTSDWNQFQSIRQDILLSFMEVVEGAGSSFAFPTRTVHMVNQTAERPLPPGERAVEVRPEANRTLGSGSAAHG